MSNSVAGDGQGVRKNTSPHNKGVLARIGRREMSVYKGLGEIQNLSRFWRGKKMKGERRKVMGKRQDVRAEGHFGDPCPSPQDLGRTPAPLAVVCRSMHRWLFTICAALSLVLCVATVTIWVRSTWVATVWSHDDNHTWLLVLSGRGRIGIAWVLSPSWATPPGGWYECPADRVYVPEWKSLGFGTSHGNPPVFIPYWSICLLTVIPPYGWFRMYRQNRLGRRKGLCPRCGYDLRASKERCPECGTAIPTQSQTVKD